VEENERLERRVALYSIKEVIMNDRRPIGMNGYFVRSFFALLIYFLLVSQGFAADQTYSGDFLSRSTLTGDWGGIRNDLAKKGVTLDMNLTQINQGVTGGGKNSEWESGGRGDINFNVDTGKLGLWPGGFLNVEFEGNYGNSVNGYTGSLMTVNTNQIFPVPAKDDFCIPAVNFAQFLSEHFGVMVGKFDTMATPTNEFAYGKGDTQFMNLAFNVDPTLLTTVPYSPLGVGAIILPTKDPKQAEVQVLVVDSVGDANRTGFDTLDANRLTFLGQGRVRTGFFGLTGHQLVGVTYSNRDFGSLDQRLFNVLDREIEKNKGSLALFYNFDQFLYATEKGSGKGIGVFGRFGISDGNPNPVNYFVSLGVGGKGMLPRRPHDQFGIGWYYIAVDNPKFANFRTTRHFLRDEYGFEAYYSFAVTPWALLTPDIQVVRPAQKNTVDLSGPIPTVGESVDTATVLGLRLRLVF
jgi:porin